jgi:hypothetical protein
LGVNRNPEQTGWTSSPKAYAKVYIDDAALGAPLLPGGYNESTEDIERPYIDWEQVRKALL